MARLELQPNLAIREAEHHLNLSQLKQQWRPDGSHDNLLDRDTVGPQAFDPEKERVYTDPEMRKDIVAYLSEYRLRVQEYDYELTFSYKDGEGYRVRDIHRGEAMSVRTKRTLAERQSKGLPIYRELSEDAGSENLDQQLFYAQEGDRIFWISPPGPKKEGYGDYGFVHEGRVQNAVSEDGRPVKRLLMTANRIENPTIVQSNRAFFELTGDNVGYINAEEFLANPRVVRNTNVNADAVLQKNFSFVVDAKETLVNKQVIAEMDPMIDEFVAVIKSGSREEKITAFYALENYALELKKRLMRKAEAGDNDNIIFMSEYRDHRYLADILNVYGYMPPIVAGSCGPTGEETRSNDLFADNYSDLMKAIFGDSKELFGVDGESFNCPNPKCGKKITPPFGDTCPHGCGLTKANAAEYGIPVC